MAWKEKEMKGMACHGMESKDMEWKGMERKGISWHGMKKQGMAWKVKVWKGMAWHGKEMHGLGSQEKERKGKDKYSSLITKNNHNIQEYHNNHNVKPKFQSFINFKYMFNYSFYIHIVIQVDHRDHL
jgi:hypothetical protein